MSISEKQYRSEMPSATRVSLIEVNERSFCSDQLIAFAAVRGCVETNDTDNRSDKQGKRKRTMKKERRGYYFLTDG